MAERIVSPGVFTRENDLSFLAQGVGQIGAAFIGPFKEGTAFVPTIVTSQSDLAEKFGTPDGTYYTEYAVQNYLREAGSATIIRVADVGGYTQVAPLGIFATSSVNAGNDKLIGVLYNTNATANIQEVGFTYEHGPIFLADDSGSGAFTLSGSVFGGTIAASINPSDVNDLSDVFGETPIVPSTGKKAYTYIFFENSGSLLSAAAASSSIYVKALEDQDYSQGDLSVNGTTDAYSAAFTPWVKSQNISNERYDLFRFVSLGHGEVYNTKFKVGISNVKAAGEDGSTDYSTFTVTIRSFSDTDRRKVVLETFNNVNLDPASPNYIARRIGDRYFTISSDGKINEFGDYTPRSKYVRVQVKEQGSFPVSAAPFGHDSYYNPIKLATADESKLPAVVFTTGSAGNTSSSPTYYSGFDFETTTISTDNKQYLKPLPNGVDVGANVVFSFDSQLSYQMTGSNSADMAKRQFVIAFQGGFAGSNPIVKKAKAGDTEWVGGSNTQGFDCSTSTSAGSLSYIRAINAISNADEYDINMVVTPGIVRRLHPSVTTAVIDMVEDRADAFYIADFNDYNDTITDATFQANSVDSNYAATYYPWVKTIDTNTNKLMSVPPSVLMPAVFASNDAIAAEWFAPAGLNRGGITGAVSVLNRLTHSERDTLYENKVNPIAAFPGQGIVAFGQKTLQDRASALDRINVRRLLITVKKFVASTSRYLVFEQNTASTRARFINTVTPYLEAIQQRQGLFAFRVVMDESNNTPDVIDRNILAGQLFLQPTRTAEFIVIDFNILPTGASFNA
jgi:hypothetical protein